MLLVIGSRFHILDLQIIYLSMITIQKVSVKDIGTIRSLAERVWPSTYKEILSEGQVEYMMDLFYSISSLEEQFKKHSFLIAYADDEPVGFASFSLLGEGVYKLHKIYIDTAFQGRGLGKLLIDYILNDLRALGAAALELNVNRNNRAKFFYERLGFEVFREEDIDIGQGYWMNDYVMRVST